MNYFTHRRNLLLRDLKTDNLDAILVTNPINVTYLTGFMGDSSYFVLSAKHAVLVSDSRFTQQVEEECPGLEANIRPHNKTTIEALGETLTKLGAKAVGVEADHVTLALLEALKEKAPKSTFAPLAAPVEKLRVLKDASEVEAI